MVGVAQLVEHLVVVQDVAGSSPVTHPRVGHDRSGNDRRGGSMTCYRPLSVRTMSISRTRLTAATTGPARELGSGSR